MELQPRHLIYVRTVSVSDLAQCTVTTTYIEAEMVCNTISTCATSRLRCSRLDHPPPGFTILDNYYVKGWQYTIGGLLSSIRGPKEAPPIDNLCRKPSAIAVKEPRAF
jgi:hypothetical protein